MKTYASLFAVALAASVSQPALASCGLPTDIEAADQATDAGRAASDLAALYYPEDLIQAVVERQSRMAFEQGIRRNPRGEELLAAMPGLVDVGYNATMTIVRPCVSRMVPVLQTRAATLMAANLSMPHMRAISEFYRSDAGVATLAALARSLRPVRPQVQADGSVAAVTGEDIRGAVSPDFLSELTPQQIAALVAFGSSEHGRAFMALTPQLERLTLDTVNGMNQGLQQELRAAVEAAVADYMRDRQGNRP